MSHNISGKIDLSTIEALLEIKNIAARMDVPFFIIGAMARDLILEHCYGIKSIRRTLDIDLGVEMPDWEKFEKLSDALLESGKFVKTGDKQRFKYKDIFIDIVPFGPIAGKDNVISWPPEHEVFMSTVGLEEAFHHSETARLNDDPPLEVKVPTLPGLAVLKLISWHDKYPHRKRDAEDLLFIMKNYEHSGIESRLYENEAILLREEDFDALLAGIRLLGQDMADISSAATLAEIKDILYEGASDKHNYKLITDMKNNIYDDFDHILLLVEKLKKGILENSK